MYMCIYIDICELASNLQDGRPIARTHIEFYNEALLWSCESPSSGSMSLGLNSNIGSGSHKVLSIFKLLTFIERHVLIKCAPHLPQLLNR